MSVYFVRKGRRLLGPYEVERLAQMARLGRINSRTQVSADQSSWFAAGELTDVFPSASRREHYATAGAADFPEDDEVDHGPEMPMSRSGRASAHAGTFRRTAWGLAALLGVLLAGVLLDLATGRSLGVVNLLVPDTQGTITSPDQDAEISAAVGMVISGEAITQMDGNEIERPLPPYDDGTARGFHGSGFLVSPDGYFLTNKKVVEDVKPFLKSSAALIQLHDVSERRRLQRIRPVLRVYISGVAYPARLVGISDKFDFAVLKLPIRDSPFFALASEPPERNSTVFSVGFPAGTSKHRQFESSNITDYFSDGDLIYTQTKGSVSRVDQRVNSGIIEHSANIGDGAFGGPVIDERGVVVGINTLRSRSRAIQYAFSLEEVRREIESMLGDIQPVWR